MKIIKILLIFFLFNSCFEHKKIELNIPIYRFDKEFSKINIDNYYYEINEIEIEFPGFIDYYLTNHIRMSDIKDSVKKSNILLFTSYPQVVLFQNRIDSCFAETEEISDEINESFGIYKYNFPEKEIPENIIFINSFNSFGVDSYKNNLIIGLDFYLAEDHPEFNSIYDYLKIRYNKKFMIANSMEYWLSSSFVETSEINTFLDELIFKGKIMYVMKECLPDVADNIIFRFSEEELQWCLNHEKNIWNEVLKMDIFYKSDKLSYISFFQDSPFTKGMPKESPGRLGYWIGYEIIHEYMKNEGGDLKELMKNNNSQEILLKSKYKP